MKFVSFILRNTLRNWRRTTLTILSIGMSLFLISTLKTLLEALEEPPMTPESAKRVVTRHATGLANMMPIAYRDKIAKTPGVEQVSASQWFGGVYKDPANFFAQFAVDADRFFDTYREIQAGTPEQAETFVKSRTSALAGTELAKRFKWSVGDRITLEGTFLPVNPELTIAGLVHGGGSENVFYFHWDYLNELLPSNTSGQLRDMAGTFIVRAGSADDIPAIVESVDSGFSSSSSPTKTESEAAFILGFSKMFGNVRLLVMSIAGIVLFTVILVAGNTMAMSIRERTREIAILKTLGFSPGRILTMTIAESALIAVTGGLAGSIGGRYLFASIDLYSASNGFIPFFDIRWTTVGLAAALSLGVALVSTFVPAYSASRLPIAVAIRRRGE